MENNSDLEAHFQRNEQMWEIWEERGIKSGDEFVVNFHFYSTKKQYTELLCSELDKENLDYQVKTTRTMLFFKGWTIKVDIKQKWTLPELQGKTGAMFLLALQTGTTLEGCGAYMPD